MSIAKASRKKNQTLRIPDVPVEVLDGVTARGAGMRPPAKRNGLIILLLEEFAAGRIDLPSQLPLPS